MDLRAAKIANLLLGAWLVLSAPLWWRSPEQAINALALGVLAIAFTFVATRYAPMVLLANTAVAVWLFVSIWILPGRSAWLVVSNMVVATLMFGYSVIPAELADPEGDAAPGRS